MQQPELIMGRPAHRRAKVEDRSALLEAVTLQNFGAVIGAAKPYTATLSGTPRNPKPMHDQDTLRKSDPQAEARREWRAQHVRWTKVFDDLIAAGVPAGEMAGRLPTIASPQFQDLVCGAHCKQTGRPCRIRALCKNGRCRLHGGRSTGPKTVAGKAKVALNLQLKSEMAPP